MLFRTAKTWALGVAMSGVVAAQDATLRQAIDGIFKEWDQPDSPGASVAVIQHGEILFSGAYGRANLEYVAPFTPETVIHVASVSKQFTAMAAVLLDEEGKLHLDDDIRKYLPELPDYGHVITLNHLLHHTSGIRDQWSSLAIAGWSLEDVITQEQILRLLFRQKELNFPPGTRHLYSNGGFTLAAEIVARVSGQSFPEFCLQRIFRPLGMEHTHFHQDLKQLVPGRAYSYGGTKDHFFALPLNYANVGATSLFTTARDLVVWLDNFRAPKIGTAATWARLQERGGLNNGATIDYALGLAVGNVLDRPALMHGGGDAGYRSNVVWLPDAELGIAVAGNAARFNAPRMTNEIAAHILKVARPGTPAPTAAAAEERTFVTLPAGELAQYAGDYPLPKIGQRAVLEVRDGKLWAAGPITPPLEVRAVGGRKFYVAQLSADVEFVPQDSGGMKIIVTQPGAVNEGERVAPVTPDGATLAQYEGAFWSEEMLTQYTVFARDGKLWLSHLKHGESALTPAATDAFTSTFWFIPEVKFGRDASGVVTGLTLGGGRITGVKFQKVAR